MHVCPNGTAAITAPQALRSFSAYLESCSGLGEGLGGLQPTLGASSMLKIALICNSSTLLIENQKSLLIANWGDSEYQGEQHSFAGLPYSP